MSQFNTVNKGLTGKVPQGNISKISSPQLKMCSSSAYIISKFGIANRRSSQHLKILFCIVIVITNQPTGLDTPGTKNLLDFEPDAATLVINSVRPRSAFDFKIRREASNPHPQYVHAVPFWLKTRELLLKNPSIFHLCVQNFLNSPRIEAATSKLQSLLP